MFEVYLRVVSEQLDPDQVTHQTSLQPDQVVRAGEPLPFASGVRKFNSWTKHVTRASKGVRVEDVESVIVGWGAEAARALGQMHEYENLSVSLVVVQNIDDPDDWMQKGIPFSKELVGWLSSARASIDIDQYFVEGSQTG